ncbi:hypothetical protein CupriaWKF_03165 [Cupriavidus sp. WKF15]|uniref:hypothetical protein n=1 Tax=Cupriavidus sp. WKF15 TaxID=3032282 RepID=UPI0023E2F2F3|nr:hypothetical protein [Cupriavidus sp. WKF15]WER46599.1 hypothetical protein CupriaWKF_03165 [Cupriavidus sp. WKF15]
MKSSEISKIALNDLGGTVASLTAGIFCLSVLFDYGYLQALGLNFADVPTTMADHVRDALLWVPLALTAFITYIYMELFTRRIEGGLTEEEIVRTSKNPERVARFRRLPYKFFVIIAIAIIFAHSLFGDAFAKGMWFAAPIMTFEIIRWAFSHTAVADSFHPEFRRALVVVLPISFFMYFFGYGKGIEQLAQKPNVQLILTDSSQVIPVTILRQLDKGILVKEAAGSAKFHPWEQVRMTSQAIDSTVERNRICRWFNVACSFKP